MMTLATVYTIYVGLASNGSTIAVPFNRTTLLDILNDRHSVGFTAIEGHGFYLGEQEPTMLILICHTDKDGPPDTFADYICETAKIIKEKLNQEAVWVTRKEEELVVI
jgi:hypothetical protein